MRSQTNKGEFGKAHAGLTVCKRCHAFYYQKSWHHGAEKFLSGKHKDFALLFTLCPACEMMKNGLFEGEITIKSVPAKQKAELVHLAKNFCAQAEEKDPMDRLIEITETRVGIVITTTENQLAHKLARHIVRAFKKSRARTLYGKGDNATVRIEITFPVTQ